MLRMRVRRRKQKKPNKMRGIYIGIDPGENTGVAIVRDGVLAECHTLPLHRAMALVREEYESTQGRFLVVYEDARLRKWFPRERDNSEYRGRLMGAGAAKRDAKIWEEYLTAQGIPFEARKPAAGQTKWSADYWKRITGWTGRTSNHARDAALLVFGRTK